MIPAVFDTSTIITRKLRIGRENNVLSAVVIAELLAAAPDDSEREAHEANRRAHEKNGTLIVPIGEDWLLASRILYWLTHRRKKSAGGKLPPQKPGASQQMMMDALIAVSARRAGALVVTEDYDDFKAIQYYCHFRLKRGSDYFDAT